jgi:hypothetical protein
MADNSKSDKQNQANFFESLIPRDFIRSMITSATEIINSITIPDALKQALEIAEKRKEVEDKVTKHLEIISEKLNTDYPYTTSVIRAHPVYFVSTASIATVIPLWNRCK